MTPPQSKEILGMEGDKPRAGIPVEYIIDLDSKFTEQKIRNLYPPKTKDSVEIIRISALSFYNAARPQGPHEHVLRIRGARTFL